MSAVETARSEERATAFMQATVVDSRGTRSARISDISPRGMLGQMDIPPRRGEFIDIRFSAHDVAGQVRWVHGNKFGVRLREQVDISQLTGSRPAARKAQRSAPAAAAEAMSGQGLVVAYGVMGVTALATAYLIVTYLF